MISPLCPLFLHPFELLLRECLSISKLKPSLNATLRPVPNVEFSCIEFNCFDNVQAKCDV